MGLNLILSEDFLKSYEEPKVKEEPLFKITGVEEAGQYVLVDIYYRKATNFGGHKLLLYNKFDWEHLKGDEIIDPHFQEKKSPVARFKPTLQGRNMARKIMGIDE